MLAFEVQWACAPGRSPTAQDVRGFEILRTVALKVSHCDWVIVDRLCVNQREGSSSAKRQRHHAAPAGLFQCSVLPYRVYFDTETVVFVSSEVASDRRIERAQLDPLEPGQSEHGKRQCHHTDTVSEKPYGCKMHRGSS